MTIGIQLSTNYNYSVGERFTANSKEQLIDETTAFEKGITKNIVRGFVVVVAEVYLYDALTTETTERDWNLERGEEGMDGEREVGRVE